MNVRIQPMCVDQKNIVLTQRVAINAKVSRKPIEHVQCHLSCSGYCLIITFSLDCDRSCDENCTGPGNKACLACKIGYSLVADEGCKGIAYVPLMSFFSLVEPCFHPDDVLSSFLCQANMTS